MVSDIGLENTSINLVERRCLAAELLNQGLSQAEVARRVGVHRQSVCRWAKQIQMQGPESLKITRRQGRKPQLDDHQLNIVQTRFKELTLSSGGRPPTAKIMADIIRNECGVQYHWGHAWRLLKRLGLSRKNKCS